MEYLNTKEINNLSWFISEPDLGIYDALNKAIKKISGEWVLVMGADDFFADNYALLRAFNKINKIFDYYGLIYSDIYIKNSKSVILKKYPNFEKFNSNYRGGAPIHHQSAFIRKEALLYFNGYNIKYKIHADYDLMLSVVNKFGALKIDDVFLIYNSNGYSSKFINITTSFFEMISIRKKNKVFLLPKKIVITYLFLIFKNIFKYK